MDHVKLREAEYGPLGTYTTPTDLAPLGLGQGWYVYDWPLQARLATTNMVAAAPQGFNLTGPNEGSKIVPKVLSALNKATDILRLGADLIPSTIGGSLGSSTGTGVQAVPSFAYAELSAAPFPEMPVKTIPNVVMGAAADLLTTDDAAMKATKQREAMKTLQKVATYSKSAIGFPNADLSYVQYGPVSGDDYTNLVFKTPKHPNSAIIAKPVLEYLLRSWTKSHIATWEDNFESEIKGPEELTTSNGKVGTAAGDYFVSQITVQTKGIEALEDELYVRMFYNRITGEFILDGSMTSTAAQAALAKMLAFEQHLASVVILAEQGFAYDKASLARPEIDSKGLSPKETAYIDDWWTRMERIIALLPSPTGDEQKRADGLAAYQTTNPDATESDWKDSLLTGLASAGSNLWSFVKTAGGTLGAKVFELAKDWGPTGILTAWAGYETITAAKTLPKWVLPAAAVAAAVIILK